MQHQDSTSNVPVTVLPFEEGETQHSVFKTVQSTKMNTTALTTTTASTRLSPVKEVLSRRASIAAPEVLVPTAAMRSHSRSKRVIALPAPSPTRSLSQSGNPNPVKNPSTSDSLSSSNGTTKETPKQSTESSQSVKQIGKYKVGRTLGAGATGKVKLGMDSETGHRVAIKMIARDAPSMDAAQQQKTMIKERRIRREAGILTLLHHPHIVQLESMMTTREHFYMMFEHVQGGQMLDYIIAHGKLRERTARKFFRQLLSAVAYCHAHGIVHRDLKIENILIDNEANVKLIDFGLSNLFHPPDTLTTFCGSLYFAAPELLRGERYIGPEIDCWSLGVILYVLVCGKVPFDDKSLGALHEKIKLGHFELPSHLSHECQQLLSSMLVVDPRKRATTQQLLSHPWTNKGMTERVNAFVPVRMPLDRVDNEAVHLLYTAFGDNAAWHAEECERVLQQAVTDPSAVTRHPILALYYLALEKRKRERREVKQEEMDSFQELPFIPKLSELNMNMNLAIPRVPEKTWNEREDKSRTMSESKPLTVKADNPRSRALSMTPNSANHPRVTTLVANAKSRRFSLQPPPKDFLPVPQATVIETPFVESPPNNPWRRLSAFMRGSTTPSTPTTPSMSSGLSRSASVQQVFSAKRRPEPINTTTPRLNTTTPRLLSAEEMPTNLPVLTPLTIQPDSSSLSQEISVSSIKSVNLKGFFSVSTTTSKAPLLVRTELLDALQRNGILYAQDTDWQWTCEYQPSFIKTPTAETSASANQKAVEPPVVRFEVSLVKLPLWTGLYGLQFRRLAGNSWAYKNVCAQLVHDLKW